MYLNKHLIVLWGMSFVILGFFLNMVDFPEFLATGKLKTSGKQEK
jgi:hypothetical protein